MTIREWIHLILHRPRKPAAKRGDWTDRDREEQRRLREVWLRLERVGREIQATAVREGKS